MSVLSIILGVLMFIAGIASLFTPLANMLAAGYIVGILLLVHGIVSLVRAIREKSNALIWIMSILSIIVGAIAMFNPGGTLVLDMVILYMLAAYFVIQGILHIALSIKSRSVNSVWVLELIAGILSVLVGILSFLNPSIAAVTIGVLIAIFFMDCGLSLITLGTVISSVE